MTTDDFTKAARAARRDEEEYETLVWRMRDWEEVERLQNERRDEETR